MSQASNLKLSFWSVYVPDTALIAPTATEGKTGGEHPRLHPAAVVSGMHKEIFGWRMQEDLFGGLAEADDRERLSTALFEKLAVHIPPENRSLNVLREFVREAEEVLAKGTVEWSSSQSNSFDDEEERRVNPLLALVCHLRWLIEIFDNQPGISVTAR